MQRGIISFAREKAVTCRPTSRRGYTLSEMVVVIVVIGLLAMIAVPVYSGIRRSSLENAAMHNARLINAARDCFALTVPAAATTWGAASDDAARLQLLITENLLAGAPTDYLSMSGGYAVQLTGGVRASTVLLHDGAPTIY
jgi:prepilin-type N-terminal cleavage/methylation domain-containing protein